MFYRCIYPISQFFFEHDVSRRWRVKRYLREHDMPWVNVGGNVANMDFIDVYDVHSTPYIYVLNREKKIIVKKLSIEELENFLRKYAKGEVRY